MRPALVAVAVALSACLAAPPGSTAVPDEEPDASEAPVAAFAQPTLVTDDFEDTSALPAFEISQSGTASATMNGSRALLDLATSGSVTLASYRAFSLDEASTFVEVIRPPDDTSQAAFHFKAVHDQDNDVMFLLQAGKLSALYHDGPGEPTTVKSVIFDPVDHAWLRLREEGGTIYWETSPDGGSYIALADAPSLVPLTYVRILLHGDSDPNGRSGGIVQLDNFNGGGPATGAWCPADGFADDFEDPAETGSWTQIASPGCLIAYNAGALQLDIGAGMDGSCQWVARPRFDLRGSWASVEVLEPIDPAEDAISSLRLVADAENWIEMRIGAGLLKVVHARAGAVTAPWMATYSQAEHGRWRIREEDGVVQFQTHGDGGWKTQHEMDDPFDLSAVEVRLAVIVLTAPIQTASKVRFDDYNLDLPP